MLIDLLSPANYIMVNRDAVKILGLNTAVYCSELLTIYKKVVSKKKFVNDEKYFEVDRDYIRKQTSLDIEDQLKCDLNLAKVNIIKINEDNPNIIYFDVEIFSSVLASEDIKLLDKVADAIKVEKVKGISKSRSDYMLDKLKQAVQVPDPNVLFRVREWIDAISQSKGGLSVPQVNRFCTQLNEYCGRDSNKAIKVVDEAIIHAWVDCSWAIREYEKKLSVDSSSSLTRVAEQRRSIMGRGESF